MTRPTEPSGTRTVLQGDAIPRGQGEPAWTLSRGVASALPVLLAVPHAGRIYPASLSARFRARPDAVMRLEDRLVDALADRLGDKLGISTLIAHAPRALIDLNRAEDDVDWSMVAGATRRDKGPTSRRVRSGLGLIPRRLHGAGEIWRGPLEQDDLEERIASVHRPYHAALASELKALRARWGAACLIDLHSMPPLAAPQQGAAAQFVFGDRFGASCSGVIAAAVFDELGGAGWRVAHNRPYAGGYVLDRHGAPRRGVHAFQLEICRATYLDDGLRETGEGFDAIAEALSSLIRRVGEETAALGNAGPVSLAAE